MKITHHLRRMQQIRDHIDQHLSDRLTIDQLSIVATLSKYHFHRLFSATFGLPVYRYIQLARLKRASCQLAFRKTMTITDIAMDAGYQSPEAFTRYFQQQLGQKPSTFRHSPDWASWFSVFLTLDFARSKYMCDQFTMDDVIIMEIPSIPVAVMEHHGNPSTLGATIQKFITWRKTVGLTPKTSATYNIFHSDPNSTPPAEYRLDLCAGPVENFPPAYTAMGVRPGLIPGGRCAKLRITGNNNDLESAALFLYRQWLPESGEELRNFPLYCQRLRFFPDVPEHEAVTDLFLPLEKTHSKRQMKGQSQS